MSNFVLFQVPERIRASLDVAFRNVTAFYILPVSYRYRLRAVAPSGYTYRTRAVHAGSYGVAIKVRAVAKPSYQVHAGVFKARGSLAVAYGMRARSSYPASYSPSSKVRATTDTGYGFASHLRAVKPTFYGFAQVVRRAFAVGYGSGSAVRHNHLVEYNAAASTRYVLPVDYFTLNPVRASLPVDYGAFPTYQVRSSYRARYVSNPYALVSTFNDQPSVTINGVTATIIGGEVFTDEGEGVWRGTLTVAGMETYLASQLGVPATVQLGTETYFMFVDSRSLRMNGPAEIDTEIALVSAGAFLSEPRASLQSYSIDTDMLASQLADLLADPIGIDWEMPDWTLYAGVKKWENVAPMTVLKELVEAAGGVVDALPSGRLVARPKFPVSPSGYLTAVPDVVLYSVADALDITEEHTTLALYGTFRIMNEAAELQDMLEYVKDENDTSDLSGFLRAYPRPYRTNIELVHTSDANIILGAGQWVYRDEEQEIEILGGEGSVQFPIVSILSTVWNDNSAGGTITAGYYQNKVVVTGGSGYGLLKIKYRTLALVYGVRSLAADTSQFLLQEV